MSKVIRSETQFVLETLELKQVLCPVLVFLSWWVAIERCSGFEGFWRFIWGIKHGHSMDIAWILWISVTCFCESLLSLKLAETCSHRSRSEGLGWCLPWRQAACIENNYYCIYIYTVYIYNDYFLCVFSISSAEGSEGHLFAPRWDADWAARCQLAQKSQNQATPRLTLTTLCTKIPRRIRQDLSS